MLNQVNFHMASESEKLHFILFPFMAQGHMIPMVEIAKLLAQSGAIVTIITTPINATRFKETLYRAAESGLQINCIEVKFPTEELGLPKDCENLDMLTSLGLGNEFFYATNQLQKPVERVLQEMIPRPNCMISDMNLYYTSEVAKNLGIPRIAFNGFCCSCMLSVDRIYNNGFLETINSDYERFIIPGFPHRFEITKQQLPGALLRDMDAFNAKLFEAEEVTYGIIINTFEELESEFVEEFKKVRGGKVWCIGPVNLLSNRSNSDSIQLSSQSSKWLDEQKPSSVIYVCFGSLCNLVTEQLIELALGLEASNTPFIWVIRGGGKSGELEKWIEDERFEERTKGRSLIIRGWAPQLAILSHKAIGGFLTHCGWNSTLEAISKGVPMATWPLFADQFMNEKLVVEVLKIGVKVGAEETLVWGEEDKIGVLVKREDVKKALLEVMDEGKEGEERRKRAKEFGVKANMAMQENGPSYRNLKLFVQEMKLVAATKNSP